MRFRMLTMSEKPMSSRREARRKTVGDVVTIEKDPPRREQWKADYSLVGNARPMKGITGSVAIRPSSAFSVFSVSLWLN